MAKVGIDAFLLDCHRDDKLKLIEAEFGIKGFAVVVRLFQRIYGEYGYYCEWNDDVGLLFSNEIKEGYSLVSEIVSASIRRDIFSKELYDKYGILSSRGIQKRYFEVVKRRIAVEVKKEYLLLNADKIKKYVNIIIKNVYINEENADENDTSKVKESNYIYIQNIPHLSQAFTTYIASRIGNGEKISKEQIELFADELCSLSKNDDERIAIAKQATMKGWKSFYPLNKPKAKKAKASNNKFNNMESRSYDMGSLEQQLLNSQMASDQ